MENLSDYIEINAEKRFGQPCIKGMRITVYDILSMLASGMDTEEIIADFPELDKQHIKAALMYAAEKEQHLRVAS